MKGNSNQTQFDTNVIGFFVLTYVLSWIFWISAALSGQNVQATVWVIPFVLGGFGPSIAGIIFIYRGKSKVERRDFWKRVIDFKRISVGWYLFILLVFPVVFALTLGLNSLIGKPTPEFSAFSQIFANPLLLVGMIIIGILTGPLSEELGWRGFALGKLQTRWSPLISSLILAPFWWAWHLPLFFMQGTTQYRWGIGTAYFWLFMIAIIPLTILLTWVFNENKRSILAAVLLHFMYNFTLGVVSPLPERIFLFQVVFLFIAAGGVFFVTHWVKKKE